jgi:glycerol-3-phosphate O-acyltransferase
MLYWIRVVYADKQALLAIPPRASLVFVINHRSNMDYLLAAYMAVRHAALSYAVGEWARVWPLQQLIRSMGAYFVRRNSGDELYRKVLARYVQMAIEGGIVQAVFPEGGLTRDGRLRPPKLGLIDYMVRTFDPQQGRDIVFIPVGVNYDRVLEDRTLLLDQDAARAPVGKLAATRTTLGFIARNLILRLRNEWRRFGYAAVQFGRPISLRDYCARTGVDFRDGDQATRNPAVTRLAEELMARVAACIPVLSVPLIACVLRAQPTRCFSVLELKAELQARLDALRRNGSRYSIYDAASNYAIDNALAMLRTRRVVHVDGEAICLAPGEHALVEYYARSIEHLIAEVR